MTQTLDLSQIPTAADTRRVNPNVTVKSVNVEWLDAIAQSRGTTRSRALDAILDQLRETAVAPKGGSQK
jgi:hypothetical protein